MLRRASVQLLLAAGAALAIAGCGSGNNATSQHTGSTTQRAGTGTTTSTTSSGTVPVGSVSRSASSGPAPRARAASAPPCVPRRTAVTIGRSGAATGHIGEAIVFRNAGPSACVLTGYPGVALVAARGHRVLQAKRTPSGFIGGLSAQARSDPVVRLAPGAAAAAVLEGEDHTPPGGLCPGYAELLVTPPNQNVAARVARPISVCNPQIHPVIAGSTGRQQP